MINQFWSNPFEPAEWDGCTHHHPSLEIFMCRLESRIHLCVEQVYLAQVLQEILSYTRILKEHIVSLFCPPRTQCEAQFSLSPSRDFASSHSCVFFPGPHYSFSCCSFSDLKEMQSTCPHLEA